jgi:putative tricarboxylic transport membrane protein
MLSTVGADSIVGHQRFTFGWTAIMDGVPFIPVLVGLFAVTQAIVLAESAESISRIGKITGGFFEGVVIYFKHIFEAIRSSAIGLFIGILPAAGMSSAGLLAWSVAKGKSKHPETFGKGDPVGVIASETATNACMPGDLVCTLALGVPGSMGAAIFLGIMIALGVVPGPLIFREKAEVVYTLFAALVLTSFLLFLFGMFLSRQMAAVTLLPNEIIVPAVLVISLLGSYAVNMNMYDVVISLAFGAIGYIMQKTGFSPIPLLLGLVLGEMVESNYHRALMMSRDSYSIFFTSAISQILCALTVFLYVMPYLGVLWRRLRRASQ